MPPPLILKLPNSACASRTGLPLKSVEVDGKITAFSPPPGVPEFQHNLSLMQQAVNMYGQSFDIRQAAIDITKPQHLLSNEQSGQVRIILQWVRDHMVYVKDPLGFEYVQSPLRLLQAVHSTGKFSGDCDDAVILFNSLLQSLGIQTRVIAVKLGGPNFNHVISSVFISGKWQDIDVIDQDGHHVQYRDKIVIL